MTAKRWSPGRAKSPDIRRRGALDQPCVPVDSELLNRLTYIASSLSGHPTWRRQVFRMPVIATIPPVPVTSPALLQPGSSSRRHQCPDPLVVAEAVSTRPAGHGRTTVTTRRAGHPTSEVSSPDTALAWPHRGGARSCALAGSGQGASTSVVALERPAARLAHTDRPWCTTHSQRLLLWLACLDILPAVNGRDSNCYATLGGRAC
jgi:hypothetical protein